MSARQRFACLAWWLGQSAFAAAAETPQEAARRAMESSIARQRLSVAAMQIPTERQRAAIAAARSDIGGGSAGQAPQPPFFTLSWPAMGAECDPLPEIELTPLIQQAAEREGLDANL